MLINDGRPNGELLLSTGTLQDANLSDCLYFGASVLAADRWEETRRETWLGGCSIKLGVAQLVGGS